MKKAASNLTAARAVAQQEKAMMEQMQRLIEIQHEQQVMEEQELAVANHNNKNNNNNNKNNNNNNNNNNNSADNAAAAEDDLSSLDTLHSKTDNNNDLLPVGKGTLILEALQQQQQQPNPDLTNNINIDNNNNDNLGNYNLATTNYNLTTSNYNLTTSNYNLTASMTAKQPSHTVSLGGLMVPPTSHDGALLPHEVEQQQQQQRSVPYYGAMADHQQQQQHEFHYTHPDALSYSDPYGPKIDHSPSSSCCCCCCCCCAPAASTWWQQSDILWRSFCYGAIDGMLTGAGIVAAFLGIGLLTIQTTPPQLKAMSIVFCAAACIADALCMALGHVWTTRQAATSHATERINAKQEFLQQTAACKGLLVERLLQAGGMLKIDAMSLADTLEGYPDLFISALIGDVLVSESHSSAQQQHYNNNSNNPHNNINLQQHQPFPTIPLDNGGGGMRTIPSYGRYAEIAHAVEEEEVDPEWRMVRHAVAEARWESCFMFVGFSLFAVIPSLIYYLLPTLPKLTEEETTDNETFYSFNSMMMGHDDTIETEGGSSTNNTFIQPGTGFVVCLCLVMACLGAWKSRFIPNSNIWALGLQATAVLLLCLGTGYGLGWLFQMSYLADFELVLVRRQ